MTDNARRAQSIERFDAVAKTTPKAAALRIISGIEKNQPRILIGNDARFMDLLQRFRPATYWPVLARRIEKSMKAANTQSLSFRALLGWASSLRTQGPIRRVVRVERYCSITSAQTTPCGYRSPRARGRPMGVIASAAKQSIVRLSKKLDCFAALAMTTSTGLHRRQHTPRRSRGADAPELCKIFPFHHEGRRECRALDAPAASHAK